MNSDNYKEEEKLLYAEYKEKLKQLKKIKTENEAVGQVFTKGLLPIYILYLLSISPSNGNLLSHQIGKRTHGLWLPSTGGIYPILNKFQKQGLIKGEWDDPKKKFQKIYTITEEGKIELNNKKGLLKDRISESLEVFKIVYSDLYTD